MSCVFICLLTITLCFNDISQFHGKGRLQEQLLLFMLPSKASPWGCWRWGEVTQCISGSCLSVEVDCLLWATARFNLGRKKVGRSLHGLRAWLAEKTTQRTLKGHLVQQLPTLIDIHCSDAGLSSSVILTISSWKGKKLLSFIATLGYISPS